jgi:adhesin transport system outer membrane protein
MTGGYSGAEPTQSTSAVDGLAVALRKTVTLHPSVRSKVEELKALGFDLDSAKVLRYPTLGLQASSTSDLTGSTTTTTGGDQYDNMHTVLAVVKQPVWMGGRIDGAIDQAAGKQKAGALAVLGVQRQLMEETAATYAGIIGARKRLATAVDNVREHRRLQELITRRQTGGIASEADIQLASSRVTQAVAQQLQLEGTLARALNDLRALTQEPMAANDEIPPELAYLPSPDTIVSGVEDASATVRQRLAEVEVARTTAELAKSDMMPSLYAKMEQDVVSSSNQGDEPLGTRVGAVLEGSLDGLGFSGWNKVQSSETRTRGAKREVDAARNDVQRTVQGLLSDLHSYQMVMRSNEQLVQSTRQTLDSFLRQYDAGRKSWIDVLNTLRDLASARLDLEQNRNALLVTKLRLATQLGQLDILAGVTP